MKKIGNLGESEAMHTTPPPPPQDIYFIFYTTLFFAEMCWGFFVVFLVCFVPQNGGQFPLANYNLKINVVFFCCFFKQGVSSIVLPILQQSLLQKKQDAIKKQNTQKLKLTDILENYHNNINKLFISNS